jgi:hypothetical protein
LKSLHIIDLHYTYPFLTYISENQAYLDTHTIGKTRRCRSVHLLGFLAPRMAFVTSKWRLMKKTRKCADFDRELLHEDAISPKAVNLL